MQEAAATNFSATILIMGNFNLKLAWVIEDFSILPLPWQTIELVQLWCLSSVCYICMWMWLSKHNFSTYKYLLFTLDACRAVEVLHKIWTRPDVWSESVTNWIYYCFASGYFVIFSNTPSPSQSVWMTERMSNGGWFNSIGNRFLWPI